MSSSPPPNPFFLNQSRNRFIPFCTFLFISVGFGNGGRETPIFFFFSPKTQAYISILENTWQEFFKEKRFKEVCVLGKLNSDCLECPLFRYTLRAVEPANQEMQTHFLCPLGPAQLKAA